MYRPLALNTDAPRSFLNNDRLNSPKRHLRIKYRKVWGGQLECYCARNQALAPARHLGDGLVFAIEQVEKIAVFDIPKIIANTGLFEG